MENKKKSVKCPYCKCSVNESYLQSHIDKEHPPLIAMKEHEQAKVGGPEKLIYGKSVEKQADKDGSKGYHVFRDRGRFGSLSSFDPSEDE